MRVRQKKTAPIRSVTKIETPNCSVRKETAPNRSQKKESVPNSSVKRNLLRIAQRKRNLLQIAQRNEICSELLRSNLLRERFHSQGPGGFLLPPAAASRLTRRVCRLEQNDPRASGFACLPDLPGTRRSSAIFHEVLRAAALKVA